MELKDYQRRALDKLNTYLDTLRGHEQKALEKAAKADKLRELAQEQGLDIDESTLNASYDVMGEAWAEMDVPSTSQQYYYWKNGIGEDIPSICFKVPTGGGKTFLASHSIGMINKQYLQQRFGLVLWIVPSTQIYDQTLQALRTKEHPYRQTIDVATGGRTLILEKDDYFTPQQVRENLLVMVLMLPSTNSASEKRERLKFFQDRSGFELFFPAEDNLRDQQALLDETPNLDVFGDGESVVGMTIKTSLANTIRLLKPIVILDEAHKAYSELAQDTRETFNPSFVMELSATPPVESNILVSISGQELDREEMIKLDLNMTWLATKKWEDTLLRSYQKIEELSRIAYQHHVEGGDYIRPICLIQVERTGKRTKEHIHAEDAKEFLIENCNVPPDQIAIKSSSTDDLDNVDLMSEDSPIQYIITKFALQEGWDCPFAYVLAVLSGTVSKRSLTQLVGRILRQPYASKTGVKALDESYVYCYRTSTGKILSAIREGFISEGLSDLTNRIRQIDDEKENIEYDQVRYRPEYRHFEGKIYLPRFVIQEEHDFRPLSYERDILGSLDWKSIDLSAMRVTLSSIKEDEERYSIGLSSGESSPDPLAISHDNVEATLDIDPVFMTRQMLDIVPNAWVAFDLVERTIEKFRENYSEIELAHNQLPIISELKRIVDKEKDKLAQQVFYELLDSKQLVFFVQAIEDYELPSRISVKRGTRQLTRENNSPIQMSLWEYEPEDEFNETEKAVAVFLDKQEELLWWYRNRVGGNAYHIKGWRKEKVYPDLITTKRDPNSDKSVHEVIVLETKGLHLKGNDDTEYKRNIFEIINKFGRPTNWENLSEEFKYDRIEFRVVFEDEWRAEIAEIFE